MVGSLATIKPEIALKDIITKDFLQLLTCLMVDATHHAQDTHDTLDVLPILATEDILLIAHLDGTTTDGSQLRTIL